MLITFKLFLQIHFEFETTYMPTPPCLKAKEVYNVKNKTKNKKQKQKQKPKTKQNKSKTKQNKQKQNKTKLNWNGQIHAYHLSSLVIIWVNTTTTRQTNVHLGIFLLFRDMISSKTSRLLQPQDVHIQWYKSTEKRYGLLCATHSMIKYPHLRELFPCILPCESVETKWIKNWFFHKFLSIYKLSH